MPKQTNNETFNVSNAVSSTKNSVIENAVTALIQSCTTFHLLGLNPLVVLGEHISTESALELLGIDTNVFTHKN